MALVRTMAASEWTTGRKRQLGHETERWFATKDIDVAIASAELERGACVTGKWRILLLSSPISHCTSLWSTKTPAHSKMHSMCDLVSEHNPGAYQRRYVPAQCMF